MSTEKPQGDDKLQAFEADVRAQHAALTTDHDAKQAVAEQAWAKYEAAKAALTSFRTKYGRVLRALAPKE
ncbi:MAG: hypothetical protein AB7O32_00580 [Vicinamibacterales bacterium]